MATYQNLFTWDLKTSVPSGHTVATGGRLVDQHPEGADTTFTFRSKISISQIDVAVAKFVITKEDAAQLTIYALPGHETGSKRVMQGIKDVMVFYSGIFGPVKVYQGYTVIEIPEGWGSQAPPLYILQTAAVFEDPKSMYELYHEVGHTWNAKAKPDVQRCRFFDEAFASYFAALATKHFDGNDAFAAAMEKARSSFVERTKEYPRNATTPIAEYGKHEMGGLSYTKGAWVLYVLNQVLGDEVFQRTMREFLAESAGKTVDFSDFERSVAKTSERDLHKFFAEWIYGTESSNLLIQGVPVADLAKRY